MTPIRCLTAATLAASLLAALYVGLWMAARRPCRENEAYSAGRLAGFEDGLDTPYRVSGI